MEDALKSYLTVTPLLVPAFAALLSGDATRSGVEPLTKDSLQTCFVHATRGLAAERTTIVLIDDLHFAPEEGRVLLVGTTRPGLDQKWIANIERIGATPMALVRLGPKGLVRLLVDAFKSERIAEELGMKIAAKSEGNPFFAFEILRGLRDGPARPSPGGSRTTPVQEFITRRVDGTWATTRDAGL